METLIDFTILRKNECVGESSVEKPQCENYGNSLSPHLFGKNFVKSTLIRKKLLKNWFHEIFVSVREFLVFLHCENENCFLNSKYFVKTPYSVIYWSKHWFHVILLNKEKNGGCKFFNFYSVYIQSVQFRLFSKLTIIWFIIKRRNFDLGFNEISANTPHFILNCNWSNFS